jgi:hypothetical protein
MIVLQFNVMYDKTQVACTTRQKSSGLVRTQRAAEDTSFETVGRAK